MIELHDFALSGNCHKVRLLLSMLGLPHRVVTIDLLKGEQHTDAFRQLNPQQQVPVLVEDDLVVVDSQAILLYLATRHGQEWAPQTPQEWAQVGRWLSFAANEIAHSLQIARLYYLAGEEADIEKVHFRGRQVLDLLNEHLGTRAWLACGRPTTADLACFPYVGLSHEGRLSLEPYPHIESWVDRLNVLPGFIGMPGLIPQAVEHGKAV